MTSRHRHLRTVATGIFLVVLSACSGADGDGERAQRDAPARAGVDRDEPNGPAASSPEKALAALLEAEAAGDHGASHALLSSSARRDYPNVDQWARDRQQLPPITAFEVTGLDGDTVEAIVEHEPGLDPFVGLSPGREIQRWTAVQEDGRWLLDAEPEIEPIFPPDEDAVDAAVAWVEEVRACDEAGAAELQAVARLFGTSEGASRLCQSDGPIVPGEADEVRSGPASAELVGQYSTDALVWARAVRIEAADAAFEVILAPIGEVWRVIGVIDA